jgi:hypothetical protein
MKINIIPNVFDVDNVMKLLMKNNFQHIIVNHVVLNVTRKILHQNVNNVFNQFQMKNILFLMEINII